MRLFYAVLFIILYYLIIAVLIEKECKANWESSTMKARWSLFSGCLVEVKPNKWIPSKNYREEE